MVMHFLQKNQWNNLCNLTINSSTKRRMKMTALWIAVGFIVGSIFSAFTMCLAFAAKTADKQMCKGCEDSTVEKELNESEM